MESLISNCCSIRLLSTKSDGFIMWMILLMIFNSIVVTPGNGLPMYSDDEMDEINEDSTSDMDDHYYTKRSWDKLQGGWGKRGWDQLHASGWGKRTGNGIGGDYPSTKILSILSSLQQNGQNGLAPFYIVVVPGGGRTDLEKRAWKNLQAGWGKRNNQANIDEVQSNQLTNDGNKGPVSKRDPGWNNLKGMWG